MERDVELYYWLKLVRAFESRVAALNAQNRIQGGVYSGRGQEAIAVGITHSLMREEMLFPLHRDLGAFLVKGVPARALMAQLYGKREGLSRGKESFLHGGSLEHGVYGATSMLGSTLPVACGVALERKLRGKKEAAVALFGEGASSRGDVHEAMNFAAIHRLPVLFVCENNRYAYSTPNAAQFALENLSDRAQAYGMAGALCDGNDLHAVLAAAAKALNRARGGGGPTLLECKTYRLEGHSAHDRASYQESAERLEWEARDPIVRWERFLALRGFDLAQLGAELDARISGELADAVAYAESCAEPAPEEALEDLYATQTGGVPRIFAHRAAEAEERRAAEAQPTTLH